MPRWAILKHGGLPHRVWCNGLDHQEVTVIGYEGPHYLPAIGARPRPAFGVVFLLIMTARSFSAATGDRRQLPVCLDEFEDRDVIGVAADLAYEETAIIGMQVPSSKKSSACALPES
jgi:hypothetical protein